MKVSCDPKISVITHSLGSCVAVVMCDTFSQVGGLLHFQLPKLLEDRVGRPHNPFMFPDTGIPLLAEEIFACGALKHRLTVKLFGGASIMDGKGLFNIGKRNYNAAKRILWRLGYFVKAEDVGGESWRTVELDVGTGMVTVKNSTSEYRI